MRWRLLLGVLPLAIFLVAVGFFFWGLDPERDPSGIPSALVGKAAPAFDLQPIPGSNAPGLATDDLKGEGPTLVNVFASWCVPCRAEHPVLERLAEQGVRVVGINYKDKPEEALAFLAELGNPYARIGADSDGRAGIEWGISGVPETFVVDDAGKILYRQVGPLDARVVEEKILPALEQAGK